MKKPGYYSSGEFARMAHVTLRTIRYYDKQNILKPSYVTEAGARFYTDEDFARLQQILLNLLSNAVKYTPDEGVVKLTVTVKPLPHDLAVFDFIVEDYMLLAVPKKYMMLQKAEKREGEKYPWMDISMMPNEFIIQDNSCYVRQEINQIFEEYGKELKPKMIVNSSMLAMQTLEREMGFCFISEVFLPIQKILIFFALEKTR